MTVAFRMGHTLVRNNFQQLPGDFTRFRPPLPERNSFLNNRPIFRDGIEPVCEVCSEIRRFRLRFLSKHRKNFVYSSRTGWIPNLLALNIHRGTDHGLASY